MAQQMRTAAGTEAGGDRDRRRRPFVFLEAEVHREL